MIKNLKELLASFSKEDLEKLESIVLVDSEGRYNSIDLLATISSYQVSERTHKYTNEGKKYIEIEATESDD